MSNNPLISVIIPTYNAEEFLEETLQSVLDQTYQNWECIIVNDGSTDSTEQIAKNWCSKDNRFRYFYKENSGVSATRNMGIEKAQGEYIAFLDADDAFLPEKLEKQLEILQKENIDFVFSHYIDFYTRIMRPSHLNNYLFEKKDGIEHFLIGTIGVNTSTVFCKTNIMRKAGGFTFHKKAEDYHLWLRLLISGNRLYYSNIPVTLYRISPISLSNEDRYCTKERLEVFSLLKNDILKFDINFNKYFNYWAKRYISLKDKNGNVLKGIIDRMKYINSLSLNIFSVIYLLREVMKQLILKIVRKK